MAAFLISAVLLLSVYIFFFAIAGLFLSQSDEPGLEEKSGGENRFLVFVPAHDEGDYLRPTLRSLKALDFPSERFHVVVIADNCTDNTALIAAEEGCEVWERTNPDLRGKGHALAWAFAKIQALPHDAVVVVDADTLASANLLRAFDREIGLGYVALQARDNLEFPLETPPWLRLISRATKSAEDFYVTRPRSKFRLYQGLQGTGFCLTTQVLREVPWNANSICEDLEYGLELARYGISVRFVEDASVAAVMTGKVKHASGQRQRWAGGTYRLIAKGIPDFAVQAVRKRDWRSLEACVYLVTLSRIPLFILTIFSALVVTIEWHRLNLIWCVLFGLAILIQSAYVLLILSTGRKENSLGKMIVGLCIYVCWISFQHLSALLNLRRAIWNRTERG